MPYNDFTYDPTQNAFTFYDTATGQSVQTAAVPPAIRHAQEIDFARGGTGDPRAFMLPAARAAVEAAGDPMAGALAQAGGAGGAGGGLTPIPLGTPGSRADVVAVPLARPGDTAEVQQLSGASGGGGFGVSESGALASGAGGYASTPQASTPEPIYTPAQNASQAPLYTPVQPASTGPGRPRVVMGGPPAGGQAPQGYTPEGQPIRRVYERTLLAQAEQAMRGGPVRKVPEKTQQVSTSTVEKPGVDPGLLSEYQDAKREAVEATAARNQAEADEAAGLLRQQQGVAGHYDQMAQAVRRARLREMQALQDEARARVRDIDETDISPDKFWQDKGTASQISAGIAIALGAVGGVLTGQGGNVALDTISRRIEQHIDAQKANLAKKKGQLSEIGKIYDMALRRTGDEEAAVLAAKTAAIERVTNQAKATALASGNPIAQAKAAEFATRAQLEWLEPSVAEAMRRAEGTQIAKQYRVIPAHVTGGANPTAALKKLKEASDSESERLKGNKTEAETGKISGEADKAPVLVYGNQRLPAAPGVGQGTVEKANDTLTRAQQLKDVTSRARQKGTLSSYKELAQQAAALKSQVYGGGAPGEPEIDATTESLRNPLTRDAALKDIEGLADAAEQSVLRYVDPRALKGGSRLWPSLPRLPRRRRRRCTRPTVRPSRCLLPRSRRSFARETSVFCPTRKCTSKAPGVRSCPSRARTHPIFLVTTSRSRQGLLRRRILPSKRSARGTKRLAKRLPRPASAPRAA